VSRLSPSASMSRSRCWTPTAPRFGKGHRRRGAQGQPFTPSDIAVTLGQTKNGHGQASCHYPYLSSRFVCGPVSACLGDPPAASPGPDAPESGRLSI
jgi:hypothetical protein